MVIAVYNWHHYAKDHNQCFVAMRNGRWTVYLPDGTTFVDDDLDQIRAAASKQGCTILL